jgi:hypothetical protein
MNLALAIPLADSWGMHGDISGWWMIVMMPLMLLFWAGIVLHPSRTELRCYRRR